MKQKSMMVRDKWNNCLSSSRYVLCECTVCEFDDVFSTIIVV